MSLSGKQIACGPPTSKPILGADAPQVSNLPKAPAVGKHKLTSKLLSKRKKDKATTPPVGSPSASEV